MKRMSVKGKITLWYTLLMALMAALVLTFIFLISRQVVSRTATDTLKQAVQSNFAQVSLIDGKVHTTEDFHYYQNGVYTMVYSAQEALIAGQPPVTFSPAEPFQHGTIRPVSVNGQRYYVMDLWLADGWDNGVWVRGLLAAPETDQAINNLLIAALIAMPAFIALAAVGGWLIARRTFRPLEHITATAETIGEGSDLSRRIDLLDSRDEFGRLAATFDTMFARLERSFEAEKQFTDDASHELRTPLAVIKSSCEFAEKFDETPEERAETIETIHRQADKMSHIISQLLSMTRLEQGTAALHWETLDLAEVTRSVCAERTDVAPKLDLTAVTVRGERTLLQRLLTNLLDNAVRYGKPGGTVWVTVAQAKEEVLLSVRDEGAGIPPEEQEKVWQRFYRADPSRSSEGTGLGLAMVQQIAALHGGYMTLQSTPGEGSTFTLHLPGAAQ